MDISFGLKISNFLYDVFPLIAVGFPFLLSTFLLCRKKAQTEQNNSYGVEKETGKDALYKKTAVLMAAATILAAISSIGGHHHTVIPEQKSAMRMCTVLPRKTWIIYR